jgi:hypothetical protein
VSDVKAESKRRLTCMVIDSQILMNRMRHREA